jgi:hypothetical protein
MVRDGAKPDRVTVLTKVPDQSPGAAKANGKATRRFLSLVVS